MSEPAYSSASPAQRIQALSDPGTSVELESRGTCTRARVTVEGRAVLAVATDPSQARGALGVAETAALRATLDAAQRDGLPVVLLLDSAGAKVDEGLPALGGFRTLFAEMLRADAHGVQMFALLGRWCFGGASLLAALCARRSYLASTLFATSGPAVIEATEGKARFDATDRAAVAALLGSRARLRWHDEDDVREDALSAAVAVVKRWLAESGEGVAAPRVGAEPAGGHHAHAPHARAPTTNRDLAHVTAGLEREHAALAIRLGSGADRADTRTQHEALARLLPPGYLPTVAGTLFRALPPPASGKATFLGTLGGTPVSALDCLQLSRWLLDLHASHAASPVVLMLDASAHAATVNDERVLLADHLVHLSRTIYHLGASGHRCVLWIPGVASGASYVAFAAPVERVSALPSARIAILPDAAAERIVGDRMAKAAGIDAWIAAGVADATLDDRLKRITS